MRKVLATDLDGTLIFEGGVSSADMAALSRWTAAGNVLVINTGRSLQAVGEALRSYGLPRPDHVIAFNGAVVADGDLTVLASTPIGPGLLGQITDLLRGEPAMLMASTIDRDHAVLAPELARPDGRPFQVAPWAIRGEVEDLDRRDLFGMPIAIPDDAVRARIEARLRLLCDGRAELHRNLFFIDVVPAGVTKGTGLARLLADFLPGHGEVYTIGDSWNDLPMHAVADLSATLPHAPDDVKEGCDVVVDSVADLVTRAMA
ncbi:HAD family hydrolase [Acidipropionibacterium virtanenii]|uniref:5-amino-6-(5-phospho-D-ribitylamino)uracil phosphatase YcsE n=1 Tax=Acidipropionibacterium virtanenii TaxID=2057246 RepID=A0A344UPR2_9ACTN|nr:HAD family hydrolase [Acidipropionibacterium virtanenii]AXE37260.1 5-amino-6-(5-phospho-D-ribitylamino)uracil phosphatase YcsE [Acidipropionibacterium virtanenii]